MQKFLKSFTTGIVSGALTSAVSVYALARTSALVMPHGFPLSLWLATVVFGLGAALVAFVIQFASIWVVVVKAFPALIGFTITVVVFLTLTHSLADGSSAIFAWVTGALLASAVAGVVRFNSSFKTNDTVTASFKR